MALQIKKALGFISTRFKEPSTCEACGEKFVCGASLKGCWCMKTELSDAIRTDLKTRFRDCLCQNCLEKLSSAENSPHC